MESDKFTHISEDGNPQMVDISNKKITKRVAVAETIVLVNDTILAQLKNNDIQTKKGPVFHTAIIAGVMGAKKTAELIPFCHPIALDDCKITIEVINNKIVITSTCITTSKTGVEMEAMTGASVAALTVYDMCKALSHDIKITETKLMSKTGGKSDFKRQ